jgi:cyclophilin family peptidyl-prolyl cis-trans isomerase
MRTSRSSLVAPALAALAFAVLAAAAPAPQKGLSPEVKKAMKDATNPVVKLSTSMGDVVVELYRKEAPKTTENFLAYVKKKHYDGLIFHRIIPTFMIQGGGFDKDLKEKATMPPIANESSNGLSNLTGTIAMARTNDPNSATAQFYINVVDNKFLDRGPSNPGGYCVFGKVIDGMDVVNEIKAVKTQKTAMSEALPLVPVVIKSASVVQ